MFLNILYVIWTLLKTVYGSCERGRWTNVSSTESWFARFTINESRTDWMKHACPLRSYTYWDCYKKSVSIDRAFIIDNRSWIPADSNCVSFSPYDFLRFLDDETLLFIGDSVMLQIYIALVCSLREITEAKFIIDWASSPQEGHFNNADVFFPTINATISFRLKWRYYSADLQKVAGSLSASIIVINFGLHYNSYLRMSPKEADPDDFRNALTILSDDMSTYLSARKEVKILLIESLPQHFSGSNRNGFFNYDSGFEGCRAIQNDSEDWRNRIMHDIKFPRSVNIIRVAQSLYSQWDAHVDGHDHDRKVSADCTHWCLDSGAFRFVRLKLWNALKNLSFASKKHSLLRG